MRKLVIGALTTIAIAIFHSVVVASMLPKDIAARIEAIPIQTLTISDQQFLKGDASGRPTTIAGTLRVAEAPANFHWLSSCMAQVALKQNTDLWRRQFESLGISTFALDSFTGRGIASTVVDQSQLGRLNMILDLYRSLAGIGRASMGRSQPNCCHGILARRTSELFMRPSKDSISCGTQAGSIRRPILRSIRLASRLTSATPKSPTIQSASSTECWTTTLRSLPAEPMSSASNRRPSIFK